MSVSATLILVSQKHRQVAACLLLFYAKAIIFQYFSISVISWQRYDVGDEEEKAQGFYWLKGSLASHTICHERKGTVWSTYYYYSPFLQETVTGAVHFTAGATPLTHQDLYCN